jgi:hypothetical protein
MTDPPVLCTVASDVSAWRIGSSQAVGTHTGTDWTVDTGAVVAPAMPTTTPPSVATSVARDVLFGLSLQRTTTQHHLFAQSSD